MNQKNGRAVKNITATPSVLLAAGITAVGYVLGFDTWLCSFFERPNVPLCVVWAICQTLAWPVIVMWHRLGSRTWEAPYLALIMFVLPLTSISYRQSIGPRLNTREHSAKLREYSWNTVAGSVLFTLLLDGYRVRRGRRQPSSAF
jgi:hypothetical protein